HTKNGPAADLIAGAPGHDAPFANLNTVSEAGAVYGFFGHSLLPSTIEAAGSDLLINGSSENGKIGASLAIGNFNGDGYADFAIGAPSYLQGLGAALLVPGSERPEAIQPITISGVDPGDNFGAWLAMGDLNSDGRSDLIIGVPGGDGANNSRPETGETYVVYGF
ncbi:MAG TPA: FG-GAP repeat protein, partial [Blastocatellia bacterium]|nr:FG-GAP repeat protein [Blastocatellia bacterium]